MNLYSLSLLDLKHFLLPEVQLLQPLTNMSSAVFYCCYQVEANSRTISCTESITAELYHVYRQDSTRKGIEMKLLFMPAKESII